MQVLRSYTLPHLTAINFQHFQCFTRKSHRVLLPCWYIKHKFEGGQPLWSQDKVTILALFAYQSL